MKVLIINTFSVQSTFPSFNTAYIKGLLEKYGISNLNLDLNQLVWNKLFSQEFIKKLHYNKEVIKRTPCPMCKVLTEAEFQKLQDSTVKTIYDALQIVKSNKAYLFGRFSWAYSVFNDVRTLIYHCYGTYFTTHIPFWNTVGFDITDMNKIYELAISKEKNPLIEIFEDIIISHIKDEKFDIVLTDIMFPWDIIPSLTFNILLKKYCPNIHINYAGQGFDEFCFSRIRGKLKEDIRYFFYFDSIFVYRNDMGIIKLILDHQLGHHLCIDNLYYLMDKTIYTNKLNNNYPFYNDIVPNYDDIKFEDYLIPEPVLIDRLSYRCFWAKCNFCSINSNKTQEYKANVKELVSKVHTLKEKYNVDNFWFLDEGCPSQTAMSFAKELDEQNIKIFWSLRTRINENWTYENLSYLYNNGLRELWIGLEHTSPRILEMMNKTNMPKEYSAIASRIFNDATNIGIGLHFCHILGFPSETEMERNDVLNFYTQHLNAISKKPFFTTFNIFGLMYDSPMYRNPNEFGISEINENDNGFYMIKVPYKTVYNDETDNLIQQNLLFTWIQKYLRTIVNRQDLLHLWSCIADTPFELLMKKHYKNNPFYEK